MADITFYDCNISHLCYDSEWTLKGTDNINPTG